MSNPSLIKTSILIVLLLTILFTYPYLVFSNIWIIIKKSFIVLFHQPFQLVSLPLNFSLNLCQNHIVYITDYMMTIKRKETFVSSNKWAVVSEKHPSEKSEFPFSLPTTYKQLEAKHAASTHAQSCDTSPSWRKRLKHVPTDSKHF